MKSKIGCVRVRLGTNRESAEIASLFAILNHIVLSTSKERKGLTSGRKMRKRKEEESQKKEETRIVGWRGGARTMCMPRLTSDVEKRSVVSVESRNA